jgi:hypothetical protein
MRRGILYRIAREQHCNVVAMAHHLDDLAETLMMSMLFGGKLRTMSPHYLNDAGDLRIIRPFAYARERQTRAFAVDSELPVIFENCPACFAKPQQRYAMKQMLAEQEKQHPRIFNSLLTAMRPLMASRPPDPGHSARRLAAPALVLEPMQRVGLAVPARDRKAEPRPTDRDVGPAAGAFRLEEFGDAAATAHRAPRPVGLFAQQLVAHSCVAVAKRAVFGHHGFWTAVAIQIGHLSDHCPAGVGVIHAHHPSSLALNCASGLENSPLVCLAQGRARVIADRANRHQCQHDRRPKNQDSDRHRVHDASSFTPKNLTIVCGVACAINDTQRSRIFPKRRFPVKSSPCFI